jgi:hypothetical protein
MRTSFDKLVQTLFSGTGSGGVATETLATGAKTITLTSDSVGTPATTPIRPPLGFDEQLAFFTASAVASTFQHRALGVSAGAGGVVAKAVTVLERAPVAKPAGAQEPPATPRTAAVAYAPADDGVAIALAIRTEFCAFAEGDELSVHNPPLPTTAIPDTAAEEPKENGPLEARALLHPTYMDVVELTSTLDDPWLPMPMPLMAEPAWEAVPTMADVTVALLDRATLNTRYIVH